MAKHRKPVLCRIGLHRYETKTIWESAGGFLHLEGDKCKRCGRIRARHKKQAELLAAYQLRHKERVNRRHCYRYSVTS